MGLAVSSQNELGVVRRPVEVRDLDMLENRTELLDDLHQQVVRQRTLHFDPLDGIGNRGGLGCADKDRQGPTNSRLLFEQEHRGV